MKGGLPAGQSGVRGGCLLILLFLCSSVFAQISSPCFNADVTRGCAPLTITVTECSNGGDNIGYNFGNGVITTQTNFTYDQPGKYSVSQVGNFGDINNKRGDTLTKVAYIEVLATPPPVFSVFYCAGRRVSVQVTELVYDVYQVNFGDGTTQTTTPDGSAAHTYADASPQTITVTGLYTIEPQPNALGTTCGNSASQTITPIPNLLQPEINTLTVSGATADLQLETVPYLNYVLFRADALGVFQEVAQFNQPASQTITQTVSNVDASTAARFRLTATDRCGNSVSSEISSVALNTTAENDQNQLNWQTAPGVAEYVVYRDGQQIAQLAANQSGYTDANVQCPNQYCYQVTALYSNGAQSVSDTVCVRAVSRQKPPVVQNLVATIQNGFPEISWEVPAGFSAQAFTIFRSENGGVWLKLDNSTTPVYRDERSNANPNVNQYCYRIQFTDACGNVSDTSGVACPVVLTGETSDAGTILNWTAYQESPNGEPEYAVEKSDESGAVYEEIAAGNTLTTLLGSEPDTVTQVLRLRIRTDLGNGNVSYSNVLEIVQPLRVFLPDAFTPNNDGLNDIFAANGLFVASFQLTIYSRWGEVVFRTDEFRSGWDGRFNGQDAPPGNYVYDVKARDFTGRTYRKKGGFVLLR